MAVRVTTEPTEEPVSLEEARIQCRVDGTDEDTLLASLITAARSRIEDWEWRKHVTQTLTLTADGRCFYRHVRSHGALFLPFAPLQSVTSFTGVDDAGDAAAWGDENWLADAASEPGRLYLPDYGSSDWPDLSYRENAVTVVYVAGYGGRDEVPEVTKLAIRLLVGHYYKNREAVSDRRQEAIPMGVDALLRRCHDPRALEFL